MMGGTIAAASTNSSSIPMESEDEEEVVVFIPLTEEENRLHAAQIQVTKAECQVKRDHIASEKSAVT